MSESPGKKAKTPMGLHALASPRGRSSPAAEKTRPMTRHYVPPWLAVTRPRPMRQFWKRRLWLAAMRLARTRTREGNPSEMDNR
jgi:hypothetical protein